MKTYIILILASALLSCGPVQETEPAAVSQIGIFNMFRGSPTTGEVFVEEEAPALFHRDSPKAQKPETQ